MKKNTIPLISVILTYIFSKVFLNLINLEYQLFNERFDFFKLFFDITIFLLFYVIVYYSLNFLYVKSRKNS